MSKAFLCDVLWIFQVFFKTASISLSLNIMSHQAINSRTGYLTLFLVRVKTGLSLNSMAPHSSTLAWKIPWTEEPGGLQSMGSHRVGHELSNFTFTFHFHALEKEMATHSSVLA